MRPSLLPFLMVCAWVKSDPNHKILSPPENPLRHHHHRYHHQQLPQCIHQTCVPICSVHGLRFNGTCTCNEGFQGEYCSYHVTALGSHVRWATEQRVPRADALENALRTDGYYGEWGMPFKKYSEFRESVAGKTILVLGDSHQQNAFIALVNMWFGEAPNSPSTANPVHTDPNGELNKKHPSRSQYVDLARKRCAVDATCPFKYARFEINQNNGILSGCVTAKSMRDAVAKQYLYSSMTTGTAPPPRPGVGSREDELMNEMLTYGVSTAFVMNALARHVPCFLELLSKKYDLVIASALSHDLRKGTPYYYFQLEEEAEIKAKEVTYVKVVEQLFNAVSKWPNLRSKFVWVSSVAYIHTNTLTGYVKHQSAEPVSPYVEALAANHSIAYIDQMSLTHNCAWANCTVEDGHFARFVNRAKVLRILDVVRRREESQ